MAVFINTDLDNGVAALVELAGTHTVRYIKPLGNWHKYT
jgi:hypothetical protein